VLLIVRSNCHEQRIVRIPSFMSSSFGPDKVALDIYVAFAVRLLIWGPLFIWKALTSAFRYDYSLTPKLFPVIEISIFDKSQINKQ